MTKEEFIANKQRLLYEHESCLVDRIRNQIEESINNSKDFFVAITWFRDAKYIDKAIEIESKIYPYLDFKYDAIRSVPNTYRIDYCLKEDEASK